MRILLEGAAIVVVIMITAAIFVHFLADTWERARDEEKLLRERHLAEIEEENRRLDTLLGNTTNSDPVRRQK